MKKAKFWILFLILCVALSSVSAATVNQIIEEAKKNSPSYQNVLLSYQNGLLSVQALEEKDKVGVSVNATVNPLVNSGTEAEGLSVDPSVTVTLPNDGNTTITGGLTVDTTYKDGTTSVSGSVGVSHTFDFNAYDSSNADALNYTSTKYSTEMSYKSSELNFEKSVLSTISQILSMESSLAQSEFNVEKQQKALDKLDALGTYSTTSPTYINAVNVLTSYQQSLDSLKDQYNNLLTSYKTLTGLDWDGVEVGEAPELELVTSEDGNTSVLIQYLSAQSSEEDYKKTVALSNTSSLKTSLSVNANTDNFYNLSGSLSYNSNNWNVSVTPSVSIDSSGDVTPQVTISGSWNNGTSSNNSVNSALNSAKMATNSYLEALSSYNESVASYTLQILQYNNKKTQAESELAYKKTLLENEQTLYDLGLSTEDSLRSAQLDHESAECEWKQLVIEGLSLKCDLEIFAL